MKISRRLLSLLLIMSFIIMLPVQNAQAADEKTKIKKLVKEMQSYEWSIFPVKEKKVVNLTKEEKAKAIAFSLIVKESDGIEKGEFGNYTVFKVSSSSFKKAALNIFGNNLKTSSLPQKDKPDIVTQDAYRLKNGTPVVYYTDGETELSYEVHSTKITKKSKNTYYAVKKIYFGYHGFNIGDPNYKITYTVKKNSKSDYGYVITKMIVEPI